MVHAASILLTIIYSLSMHLSIHAGLNNLLAWIVLITACVYAVIFRKDSIKMTLYTGLAALALLNVVSDQSYIIYLPPIVVPSVMLVLFGSSLFQGKEAFISQLARRMNGGYLNEKEAGYTRKVTWVWTLFFLLMIAESLLLSFFADRETWSAFTNIYNYLFIIVLFSIEYLFRIYYLKRLPSMAKLLALTTKRDS
ncbi:MAG: hypothetical protein ABW168_10190 [Sedimenticola sp.]